MDCHQCGACCTEISISSSIPKMEQGKPAGIRCVWLNDRDLCLLFNNPLRPAVCSSFQASREICGTNKAEAIQLIRWYEQATSN